MATRFSSSKFVESRTHQCSQFGGHADWIVQCQHDALFLAQRVGLSNYLLQLQLAWPVGERGVDEDLGGVQWVKVVFSYSAAKLGNFLRIGLGCPGQSLLYVQHLHVTLSEAFAFMLFAYCRCPFHVAETEPYLGGILCVRDGNQRSCLLAALGNTRHASDVFLRHRLFSIEAHVVRVFGYVIRTPAFACFVIDVQISAAQQARGVMGLSAGRHILATEVLDNERRSDARRLGFIGCNCVTHGENWKADLPHYSAGVDSGINHAGVISGLHSRALNGASYNQWVVDDTQGQLRMRLATSTAASQLNLGYLVAQSPSSAQRGQYRGTGFELRTDGWGVLRTVEGMLVSTTMRAALDASVTSTKMDTAESIALFKGAQDLTLRVG